MKGIYKPIAIAILIASIFQHCRSEEVRISNRDDLFQNCMETFEDKEKCSKFLEKSEADLLTEEETKRKQRAELTTEQLEGLKLRSSIKSALQSKNRPFVLSYLGEPDSVHKGGDQREYLIYTRPVSKYTSTSEPDDEIVVIMRRGKVDRVNHTPPPGSQDAGFSIKKLMQNKENRETESSESSPAPTK
ncbi:hypothetical protein [Leptospira sp. GIMC2001]|uniref:hypothetical protein n=1 Tax=Leptospira sp. GIMC2001 TaxID=1513297 RepID=UPI00234A93F9|nr:hypothetical protein [Leptospira sp. GIMC2001]WCL49946.1 hypothetical protein O4O04_03760 [Leptospira sp. GIMC2001]